MKKLKYILPLFVLITCCVFMSACGKFTTTYVSPTISVDRVLETDIQQAANKAILSGVSIYTEAKTKSGSTVFNMGSGVIYKLDKELGDAYIITNCHMIYSSNYADANNHCYQIKVELYGSEGTYYVSTGSDSVSVTYGKNVMNAAIVGESLKHDLAVLKITGNDILKKSDARQADISPDTARLAQTVITVGNPLGQQLSVTRGIVSKESENVLYSDFENVVVRCIRIDAPINGGNSGGGLFNAAGELLGIVNAGNSDAENIGSAIPVPLVTNVCDNIIYGYEKGVYKNLRTYNSGITVAGSNSHAVLDQNTGLVVIKEDLVVTALTSPALSSGLKLGDIIRSAKIVDGEKEYKIEFSRAFEFEEFLFKLRPTAKLYVETADGTGLKTTQIKPETAA